MSLGTGLGTSLVGGSIFLTRHLQNNIVFMPPTHIHDTYGIYNGISYREAQGRSQNRTVIIYSHGNAEDICVCGVEELSKISGCTVIAYDYPGYGNTRGSPSEASCISALETMVEYVHNAYPRHRIVLCGRSLGTGVTVQYAYKSHWRHPIVLVSPFKSIGRVLCDSCVTDTISGMFQSWNVISKLQCPVKIIHGTYDNVVPITHGKQLYTALRNPLRPVWKSAGHNDITVEKEDLDDVM